MSSFFIFQIYNGSCEIMLQTMVKISNTSPLLQNIYSNSNETAMWFCYICRVRSATVDHLWNETKRLISSRRILLLHLILWAISSIDVKLCSDLLGSHRVDDGGELRTLQHEVKREFNDKKRRKEWYKFSRELSSTFRDAPPTRNPSMSSFLASSAELPPLTEPVESLEISWNSSK